MCWTFRILDYNLHTIFGVITMNTEMYIHILTLMFLINIQDDTVFVAHSMGGLVVKQVIRNRSL